MSKKGIILTVVAVLLLLIIAGLFGCVSYLSPRLKVSSFTGDLAPLASRDIKLNNELSDYFDNMIAISKTLNFEDPQDVEKFRQELRDASQKLNSAKSDFEAILSEINRLESPAETASLKQAFVELNEFYISALPDLGRNFTDLDKFLADLKNLTDQLAPAVAALDLAKINDIQQKLAALQRDSERFEKEADKRIEEVDNKENEILKKAQNEVQSLENKYGGTWVSSDLKFEIEAGLK